MKADRSRSFRAFRGPARDGHRAGGVQSGLKYSGFTAAWDLVRSIIEPPGLNPDTILKPQVIKYPVRGAYVSWLRQASESKHSQPGCAPADAPVNTLHFGKLCLPRLC